jgi:hypothetical protein
MAKSSYVQLSGATDKRIPQTDLDLSVRAVITYACQFGLTLYQDTKDSTRVMFDATEFNTFGGYTATKGIKGKFVTRLKRKLEPRTGVDDTTTNARSAVRNQSSFQVTAIRAY